MTTRKELIEAVGARYRSSPRSERKKIPGEFVALTGCHRKHAIGADFGASVALLAEQAGIGAKYNGSRMRGVRRIFLSRIGYFIYYKASADELQVLAFWHASREHQPAL